MSQGFSPWFQTDRLFCLSRPGNSSHGEGDAKKQKSVPGFGGWGGTWAQTWALCKRTQEDHNMLTEGEQDEAMGAVNVSFSLR